MAIDCPECDLEFNSWQKLRFHHKWEHDESLPNSECEQCGASFYSEYQRKHCSDDCRYNDIDNCGSSNPNYRGGKEQTSCDICGEMFKYYTSEKPGYYCSDCVEHEAWRDPPVISGSDHPHWNGGKITVSCDECDAKIERYPNQITGEATFCSPDCQYNWLSDAFTGEGHPNCKGGGMGPYGKGWNEVRAAALDRDDHECVRCGTTADELGRNPDVHHIVPVRVFVESPVLVEQDAHTLDNVVSLCPACHRRAEFGDVSRAELRYRGQPHRSAQVCGSKTVASPSSSAL